MADISGALAGAGLALGGKIVFDWLANGRKRNGNGAGEKPVEYWHEEIRAIVRAELDDFESRRSEAIRRIVREEIER